MLRLGHMLQPCMCVLHVSVRPPCGYCPRPTLLGHSVPCPPHNIRYTCTHSCVFHYKTQWESNTEIYKSEQHAATPTVRTLIPDPVENPWNNSGNCSAVLLNLSKSRWKVLRLWELYFWCDSPARFKQGVFFFRRLGDFAACAHLWF